ncbi:O-antigen ligase family protein [Bacillus sp. FJAT-27264]|uniref:O-antigen ligase family protein n=1 Tax=Paenibacillus sp. (strain DSM 101736 / FJAT-27264) TaxID=1850362 RepID=UPI000A90A5AA|nr:O-antigen ligase family protein [Bacillus sp. FJAT-27264]
MMSRNENSLTLPSLATLKTAGNTWALAAICLVLPLVIGFASAKLSPANSLQGAILAGVLFPAFLLALLKPRLLLAYTLLIWAIAPELRRISDWSEGVYHSVSMLSLAPLLTGATLAIPVLREIHKIKKPSARIILLFGTALVYGALIGLAKNGMSSVYDLANYLVPLMLIPYFAVMRFTAKDIDRLLYDYANIAVLVSIYGIVQYLVVPPWDAFWMNHAEMISIGFPVPLEIRVFSTLNSPGPAAAFLVFALVPMILEKRWQGTLRWVGVMLVVVCLLTTLVRAAWLVLLVMLLVYIASSPSKGKWKTLLQLIFVAAALFWIVPKLPGAEGLVARMETLGSVQEDHSYNERLDLWQRMVPMVASNPVGQGIGSVGQGTKIGNGGELGEYGNMDNGFIALLLTFGALGGLFFFWALGAVLKQIVVRVASRDSLQPYARLSLAAWMGAIASLMSDNGFPGLKGYLIWMLIGLGLSGKEIIESRKKGAPHAAIERKITSG